MSGLKGDLAPHVASTCGAGAKSPSHQDEAKHNQTSFEDHAPFEKIAILRILVTILGAGAVWFRLYEPFENVSLIGALALLFAIWPIVTHAVENLLERRMTMELSMMIAIVAAAAISEMFTALVITLFVLIAEELEHLTLKQGRGAILELMDFIPQEARVRRAGEVITLSIHEVRALDHVLVSPGEKVPVDGTVVDGHSYLDQSRITGESMPCEKRVGDVVYAGSINQMGVLEVKVEKVGRDTSFGQIIEAVEAAEKTRAPVQRLADKLAGYLVYFAFGAALLTYWLTNNIRDTISVIIVAGACGVAAGTPLAILGGIGRAARLGSIIKGGVHLETLGRVDTIVVDKTGTLTLGAPQLTQIIIAKGQEENEILRLAAAAEFHSEHPLARAIVEAAQKRGLNVPEPRSFSYQIGRGVSADVEGKQVKIGNRLLLEEAGIAVSARQEGQAGSDLVVAVDGEFVGEMIVKDPLRPEVREALISLRALSIRTILLTGDIEPVARVLCEELGIAEFQASMLPQDKLSYIHKLIAQKHVVAMVGDGVNDAPALSAAQVGVAMGSGTDIAKESADVLLIGNDFQKLVETLRIARQTRGIIWQNFGGTIAVDALGIVLAAFGFLNPLLAAFIHVGSELAFLLNSARLLTLNRKKSDN